MAGRSLERELLARYGREDFWFFCKRILGLSHLQEQPHREMAGEMMLLGNPYRFMLQLWPRETYKTTVFTQAGAIWLLVRNPEERILLTNAKLENAGLMLDWIKHQFETNELLRWVYGDFVTSRWYKDRIWVAGCNRLAKEASVQVASIDSSVVSQHFLTIIGDDLVSREGVGSQERVRRTILYYRDLQDLATKETRFLFVGTRWDVDDLWGFLIDDHLDDKDWRIRIEGIVRPDGSLLFPAEYPTERIERLRREKGAMEFSCQYMNDPLPDASERLPDPRVYADLSEVPTCTAYMMVDPAIAESERSSDRAIAVVGQDAFDNLWVLDEEHGTWPFDVFIDRVFAVFQRQRYRPRKVGIETVAFQKALLPIFASEMRRRGVFLPIVELKPDADKHRRILALEPWLANGKFFVRADMRDLLSQIRRFPITQKSDLLDAVAYVVHLKRPAGANAARERLRQTYRAVSKTGF